MEKLKKHGFETKALNIYQKIQKYQQNKDNINIYENTGFPRVPCGPVDPCGPLWNLKHLHRN